MTSKSKRRRRAPIGRPFQLGFDPRRHILTREENSRGGTTSWKRFMVEWRTGLNLPGGKIDIAKVGNIAPLEAAAVTCPQCGGPAVALDHQSRCTVCGYQWCDGCSAADQEGGMS